MTVSEQVTNNFVILNNLCQEEIKACKTVEELKLCRTEWLGKKGIWNKLLHCAIHGVCDDKI